MESMPYLSCQRIEQNRWFISLSALTKFWFSVDSMHNACLYCHPLSVYFWQRSNFGYADRQKAFAHAAEKRPRKTSYPARHPMFYRRESSHNLVIGLASEPSVDFWFNLFWIIWAWSMFVKRAIALAWTFYYFKSPSRQQYQHMSAASAYKVKLVGIKNDKSHK